MDIENVLDKLTETEIEHVNLIIDALRLYVLLCDNDSKGIDVKEIFTYENKIAVIRTCNEYLRFDYNSFMSAIKDIRKITEEKP